MRHALLTAFCLVSSSFSVTQATAETPVPTRIPAELEAVTVLALDASTGRAVVRISGKGLAVVGEDELIPASEDPAPAAELRFRVVDVLADRIVVEEVARSESEGRGSRRLIRIFKPARPGLASRIEVLDRELARPQVPDRDPPTEMPSDDRVRSVRAAPAGGDDPGGRNP